MIVTNNGLINDRKGSIYLVINLTSDVIILSENRSVGSEYIIKTN